MGFEKFKCESCGGEMEFNPKTQNLKCVSCGTEQHLEKELSVGKHALSEYESNLKKQGGTEKSVLECSSCGATIELSEASTSTSCPYCSANIVLSEKALELHEPDGLRPFAVEMKEVGNIFRNWVSKKWFAPSALKNLYQSGKIMGIYLPYWVFDTDADCEYTAEGGKDRTVTYKDGDETKTRVETDWYPTRGTLFHRFVNKLMRASTTLKEGLLRALGGFKLEETIKFNSSYLSGYGSEVFRVPMPSAYEDAKEEMRGELVSLVEQQVCRQYDRVRNVSLSVAWESEFYRLVLLPVYSMSYAFNGKVFQILINGETGHVVGEYPKSPFKIAAVVIIVAIILAALYYFSQVQA